MTWTVLSDSDSTQTHTFRAGQSEENLRTILCKLEKEKNEYNDEDWKLVKINSKAMNALFCAFNSNEFNKV